MVSSNLRGEPRRDSIRGSPPATASASSDPPYAARRPAGPRIRSDRRGRQGLCADAHGRRAAGAPRSRRPTRRRSPQLLAGDQRDDALYRGATARSRCAPRAICRRFSTALAVEGRALEALRLLALATFLDSVDESRAGIRRAPGSFPLLEAASGGAASFKGETAQTREQDRPVGRRGRPREPGAEARSATGCASSARACGARSSRTCAARKPRSTCRIRSSPSATAATSSS